MNILFDIVRFYHELFVRHPIVLAAIAGIIGLFIGSFLNVVALRIPKKESFVYPPSHCVHCKHRLGPLDLLPVFSYVWLRGKCRYCRAPISPIYPIGESLNAIAFAVIAWKLGPVPELLPGLFFAAILTAVTMTDLKYMLIPDKIVLFAVIVGLILRLFIHPLPIWNHLIGMVVGGGVLYVIALLSLLLLRKEGMGGGDIKLFTFIGLMLGIQSTLLTLFVASLLGSIFGISSILLGRMNKDRPIPFGPFICLGALLCYLWGNDLISWYIHLVLG